MSREITDDEAIRKAFNSLSPFARFSFDETGGYQVVMYYAGSEVERYSSPEMKDVLAWLKKTYPEALWNPMDYGEHNLPKRGLTWLRAVERQMIFGRKRKIETLGVVPNGE